MSHDDNHINLKLRELSMSLRDFSIIAKIGEGSYSSVHKVKRISDGQEYALKKVPARR